MCRWWGCRAAKDRRRRRRLWILLWRRQNWACLLLGCIACIVCGWGWILFEWCGRTVHWCCCFCWCWRRMHRNCPNYCRGNRQTRRWWSDFILRSTPWTRRAILVEDLVSLLLFLPVVFGLGRLGRFATIESDLVFGWVLWVAGVSSYCESNIV